MIDNELFLHHFKPMAENEDIRPWTATVTGGGVSYTNEPVRENVQ